MSKETLTPTEKLNRLLKKKLSKRELIWLRLQLEERGFEHSDHSADSSDLHQNILNFISYHWQDEYNAPLNFALAVRDWTKDLHEIKALNGFYLDVGTYLDQRLLNKEAFNWIAETGRQPKWLLNKLLKHHFFRYYSKDIFFRPPVNSSEKEVLIARFDHEDRSLSDKQSILDNLHNEWNEKLREEQPFNWYKNDPQQAKKKYECAWDWYSSNKPPQRRRANPPPKFNNLDEVLAYIDDAGYSLEESLYHLEQIKKKFKSQQVAANRKGKKQTNLSLSEETREMLELLSNQNKMTRTELVEYLIQEAYKNGI